MWSDLSPEAQQKHKRDDFGLISRFRSRGGRFSLKATMPDAVPGVLEL